MQLNFSPVLFFSGYNAHPESFVVFNYFCNNFLFTLLYYKLLSSSSFKLTPQTLFFFFFSWNSRFCSHFVRMLIMSIRNLPSQAFLTMLGQKADSNFCYAKHHNKMINKEQDSKKCKQLWFIKVNIPAPSTKLRDKNPCLTDYLQ